MTKKQKAIDFATEHFSSKTSRKITVEEWADSSGKPLEIFVSPMTLAEKRFWVHPPANIASIKSLDPNGIIFCVGSSSYNDYLLIEK